MKPFYSVKFNARMCNMKISINGIPLIGMEVEGQCSTNYPFNHLLLESGLATLKCEARPLKGTAQLHKEAFLSCKVEMFDMDFHRYQPILTMAQYETPLQDETTLPYIVHEDVFQVSVPYSMIGWKQSIKLDRLQNRLRTLVFNKYNSIIAMMQNHSFAQYESAFRERESIIGACYYMSENEKQDRMKDVENDIVNCTRIAPLSYRDVLEFAADGRLVRLIKKDGESSLRLMNDEAEEETIIELWLQMKPGSYELTII